MLDQAICMPPARRTSRTRQGFPVWRMLVAAGLVVAVGVAAFPFLPQYYISYANLAIRPTSPSGEATYTQNTREALDDNAVQTKMDMLKSAPLQRLVADQNDLAHDAEVNPELDPSAIRRWLQWLRPGSTDTQAEIVAKLVRMLDVKRDKHSYVLQIGYEATDPGKSVRLTNTLINAFIADGVDRKNKLHESVLRSMQYRIDLLQAAFKDAEAKEHAFLVGSGLIHKSEIESLHHQLAALSTALATAHARMVETSSRATTLSNALRTNTLESVNEALTSPLIQHLRERLIGLSTGAGVGSGSVPSGGSDVVINSLKQAITTELLHLLQSAHNDKQTAQATEAGLQIDISRIDTRLTQLQESERTLEVLDHDVVAARGALQDALNTYDSDSGKQYQPDVELVAATEWAIRPVFPNILIYIGGVLMLALTAAILPALPTILRLAQPR